MTVEAFPQPASARSELSRGQFAEEALANPLIAEALGAWEAEITQAWKTSPLRDTEGRERLRLMLEAAAAFRTHLERTIETGKLQQAQIARERSLKQRAADGIKEALR